MPHAATMNSIAASSGRARTERRPSRKRPVPGGAACGVGCTPASAMHSRKNDSRVDAERPGGAGAGHEGGAADRSEGAGDVDGHRVEVHRPAEVPVADDLGDHRPEGRHGERAGDAEQRGADDHHRRRGQTERPTARVRTPVMTPAVELGRDDQPLAVEAVGGGAGPGHEHQQRGELGEVDHTDQEGRAGQVVDEQRLGDGLAERAEVGHDVADEVAAVRRLAQRVQRRGLRPASARSGDARLLRVRRCHEPASLVA